MKRFLVFGGIKGSASCHSGGWLDLLDECDTMAEVQECLHDWYDPETKWYHVVNSSDGMIFMFG